MKSALRGKTISAAEVRSVSPEGFWLRIDGRDLFVSFKHFPWFGDATIRQIACVERPSSHHLRWPELDIDLALASIEHPERFPLMSRALPSSSAQRPKPAHPLSRKARPASRRLVRS